MISTQRPTGVVYVPASPSPVLVRVNVGDARIMGFEHQFGWSIALRWSVGTVLTILHAKDTATGLAPSIEGGTSGPTGWPARRTMCSPSRARHWRRYRIACWARRSPRRLYTTVHGYTTLAIRGGLRFGTKHERMFELENLSDANYRGIAWGLDAPGRSVSVACTAGF